MKRYFFVSTLLLTICMIVLSCSKSNDATDEISIKRYETLLFETPTEQLPNVLKDNENEYRYLLNADLNNTEYMRQIMEFASDPTMKEVYNKVHTKYADLGWLEDALKEPMEKAYELFPDLTVKYYYTLITGSFNYNMRVISVDSFLAIDISQYAINDMSFSNYFGYPKYLMNLLDSSYILPDCMFAVAQNAYMAKNKDFRPQTLLDFMVLQGKLLYFMNQVLPDMPLEKKLRYTTDQLAWANENESNVWGYIVQKQLLYSSDETQIRDFIDDAPKTRQFSNSAPRLADFIGLKIVETYVEKTNCTMQELFMQNDSQKILAMSGYKPQKN